MNCTHTFLTGATGTLGLELLPRLLEHDPGQRITVLLRGRTRAEFADRWRLIQRCVWTYWPGLDLSCVHPLGGDITLLWRGRMAAVGLLLAIVIGVGSELFHTWRFSGKPAGAVIGVILLSIALSHLAWGHDWVCTFSLAVLFVAATDAFSQLWGRLLGPRKLCQRLSPNKTLEGLLGGLLTTAVVALLLGFLNEKALAPRLIVLGLLTAVAGTAGNLLFSAYKRTVGTKDFSHLPPGHGGVLDRFDSLITAAPVLFWSKAWLLG